MSETVVIVGAGQAGCAAAARLRKRGFDGRVVLLGEEPFPPYQRPPLSKGYLKGELERERLWLRPHASYEDKAIELRSGVEVRSIDRAAGVIELDAERLAYDRLILTTGARPRRLPAAIGGALKGVHVIRSIADVDAVAPEFAPARRVLIVGGGYIGLEVAAVANQLGLDVTLVEAAPRILGRVAAPATADFFRALHREKGVRILENVSIARLTGEDAVDGALLADGSRLACDFVVLGVGVDPDVRLARAAGLAIDDGVAVDAQGRTSDPRIWAAGDCASFPHRGRRVRLESVGNAIDQAEAVADAILGSEEPYRARPWFWSDQWDVKLQIAGLNADYDRTVERRADGYSVWYYAGDALLAVDAMNDARAYTVGKKLIENDRSPAAEAIADPETDLRALMKAELAR